MERITQYVEQRLKLRVNGDKSALDRATRPPLLGFAFFTRDGQVKVRLDPKARQAGQGSHPQADRPQLGRVDGQADP